MKVNIDPGGKPNSVPERRWAAVGAKLRRVIVGVFGIVKRKILRSEAEAVWHNLTVLPLAVLVLGRSSVARLKLANRVPLGVTFTSGSILARVSDRDDLVDALYHESLSQKLAFGALAKWLKNERATDKENWPVTSKIGICSFAKWLKRWKGY